MRCPWRASRPYRALMAQPGRACPVALPQNLNAASKHALDIGKELP
ncbi:hypothetical protein EPIB1_2203 [Tritonibacter mobilis]|nr:hypothetical protein EPIB1_2203 [Tritonibacter mobilis]